MQSEVGAWKSDQASAANGIVQIRPTSIDKDGILVFDKMFIYPQKSICYLCNIMMSYLIIQIVKS